MVSCITDLFIVNCKMPQRAEIQALYPAISLYMWFFEKDFFYHFNSKIWKSGLQLLEDINATFFWNQWLSFSSENACKAPFW